MQICALQEHADERIFVEVRLALPLIVNGTPNVGSRFCAKNSTVQEKPPQSANEWAALCLLKT